MQPEMRRPPVVDIREWVDEVDRRLGREVAGRAGSRRRRAPFQPMVRVMRSLARPMAHGTATVAAAVVLIAALMPGVVPAVISGVPASSASLLDSGPEPVAEAAETAATTAPDSLHPPLDRLLPADDAGAVTVALDIQKARAELTGTPQSDARAVPTPDGGGLATAALRPTVR